MATHDASSLDLSIPNTLAAICQRFNVIQMSVFGSNLTGTQRPDSDLDLLVWFQPEHTPDLLQFVRLESLLSEAFQRPVDLHTPASLSRYFRQQVLDEAITLYAAES